MKWLWVLAMLVVYQAHGAVKLSTSGNLCHTEESPYFDRIKNYVEFETLGECAKVLGWLIIEECIDSGECIVPPSVVDGYEREVLFGGWDDSDGNCLDTRQQLLATSAFSHLKIEKCKVVQGRWISLFTGKVIDNPSDMDIDHIVPLHYAYQHGADKWTQEAREAFATDADNLWAVELGLNRAKGDSGLTWLPPYNQCQYILTFMLILDKYKLDVSTQEQSLHQHQRLTYCGY